MYERLLDKAEVPALEDLLAHIGQARAAFAALDAFLRDELGAQHTIGFDAHSRCWKLNYKAGRYYLCDIIAERDAYALVTRLPPERVEETCEGLSPYARTCVAESPFRHRGWIEYRVRADEELADARALLGARVSAK